MEFKADISRSLVKWAVGQQFLKQAGKPRCFPCKIWSKWLDLRILRHFRNQWLTEKSSWSYIPRDRRIPIACWGEVAAGRTFLIRVPQIWDLQSQNSSMVLIFKERCKAILFLTAEHTEKTLVRSKTSVYMVTAAGTITFIIPQRHKERFIYCIYTSVREDTNYREDF